MAKFFPSGKETGGKKEAQKPVRSWDRAFLARRARDANAAQTPNGLAAAGEYFGAVAVARGVSRLAERVFGVSLAFQEMLPGEAWCADARKLVARDAETNEALGVIYLDVVARPGKFPHAAHFVARCGRCLLYTSPSPRDATLSRMPSSA